MLHHLYGVPKHDLEKKAFGCFRHRAATQASPLLRGFSDDFVVPVSRWTEVRAEDLPPHLETLAISDETGPCLVADPERRAFYMFNHIEYDTGSLADEHARDAGRAGDPVDYYPDDDPARPPANRWRSHAHLLFGNWINFVYQETPYRLEEIGADPAP